MARSTNGTTDKMLVSDTTDTDLEAGDFSAGGWVYFSTFNNYDTVFNKSYSYALFTGVGGVGGGGYYYLGGNEASITFSPAFTTGEWQHVMWTRSGSDNIIYRNAVSCCTFTKGTTTHTAANLGFGNSAGGGSYFAGRYAEWAFWKGTVLATNDVSALAAAYAPTMVRPDALTSYWPFLGRSSPETERLLGLDATLTGTGTTPHPRIIYPRRKRTYAFTAAAGGATVGRLVQGGLIRGGTLRGGRLLGCR